MQALLVVYFNVCCFRCFLCLRCFRCFRRFRWNKRQPILHRDIKSQNLQRYCTRFLYPDSYSTSKEEQHNRLYIDHAQAGSLEKKANINKITKIIRNKYRISRTRPPILHRDIKSQNFQMIYTWVPIKDSHERLSRYLPNKRPPILHREIKSQNLRRYCSGV